MTTPNKLRLLESRRKAILAASDQEYCKVHRNELTVGFCEATNDIVCNTCIFEKKLTSVKFTALVSKDLRTEFNAEFNRYIHGMR